MNYEQSFGTTALIIGRLSAIQGDCSYQQVLKRLIERYGENNTPKLTKILQTMESWGIIQRHNNIITPITTDVDDSSIVWLIEKALQYHQSPIDVNNLYRLPILFPYRCNNALYAISTRGRGRLKVVASGATQYVYTA